VSIRLGVPIGPLANTGAYAVGYSPDFIVPRRAGSSMAVTIHDLAWIVRPDLAYPGMRAFLDKALQTAITHATQIFAVSDSMQRELVARYPALEPRVVVSPNGVETRFFQKNDVTQHRSRFDDLPETYLLMVGTIEPRKNHLGVFEALERMPDLPPVVIAGHGGWSNEIIMRRMRPLAEEGRVVRLGFVDDAVLPTLYHEAAAILCASWYEGFDLPLLEALAAGKPVAASDIPVHREVAGELALLFDPASPEDIGVAIEAALRSDQSTDALSRARQDRARKFPWDASADVVVSTLKALLGERNDR
jgi:glycosyltransferase involved in cell wall biosynthesis